MSAARAARSTANGSLGWSIPLVWSTYVRSVTAWLEPDERARLREAFQDRFTWDASRTVVIESPVTVLDPTGLSADGRAVDRVLTATDPRSVDVALEALPTPVRAAFEAMSPIACIDDVRAPLIVLIHDRHDHIIPVSESRQLWAALRGRPGASYTELEFRHMDPRKLSPLRLARELPKLFRAVYPIYRQTAA